MIWRMEDLDMHGAKTTGNRTQSVQFTCRVLMILGGLWWFQGVQAEPKDSQSPSLQGPLQGTETVGDARRLPEHVEGTEPANLSHPMSDLLGPGMAAIDQRYMELAGQYGPGPRLGNQAQADSDSGQLIERRLSGLEAVLRRTIWSRGEFAGMNIERTVKVGFRMGLTAIENPEERLESEQRIAGAYEMKAVHLPEP